MSASTQSITPRRPLAAGAPRPRVGVSSCLLGQTVRYDGGHKLDRVVTDVLGNLFELVAFCPEMAAGLGAPRPAIRLAEGPGAPLAQGVDDPTLDVTDALREGSRHHLDACADLSGYVLKRGSPSCGVDGVTLHRAGSDEPAGHVPGIFAAVLREHAPLLPIEDEQRLANPEVREHFVTRVLALGRWRSMLAAGPRPAALTDFHARHAYLLDAHDASAARALGRFVAAPGEDLDARASEYLAGFMRALARPSTRERHADVLARIAGNLERRIDADERAELASVIERYRDGELALAAPLALLGRHLRRHPAPHLAARHYLEAAGTTAGPPDER